MPNTIKRLFYFQIFLVFFVTCFTAFVSSNPKSAAFSALAGGGTVVLPSLGLIFYFRFRCNFWAHDPVNLESYLKSKQISVIGLIFVQAIKSLASVIVIFFVKMFFTNLHWPSFLAAYFLSLQAYFFAMIW